MLTSTNCISKMSLAIKVFVYGTLKRGQPNHNWLTNSLNGKAKFIATGRTTELFPLVIGTKYNIPFLLDRKGIGNFISGEIYEVDEPMFSKLDILEDYPKYYDREIQKIQTENGDVNCWLYLIRSFPESMLAKKLLSSYSNSDEQPYCERSRREKNVSKDDLN